MKFLSNTTWEDVFAKWKQNEANYSGWIKVATELKGWPDWETWRRFSASLLKLEKRDWQLFIVDNPFKEIPTMLMGPYAGFQDSLLLKNTFNFNELLDMPERKRDYTQRPGIVKMIGALPFDTQMIGLIRDDTNKVVCIEGHHRAIAITLAAKQNKKIDFGDKIKIALAHLPSDEVYLLDEALARGSAKEPK